MFRAWVAVLLATSLHAAWALSIYRGQQAPEDFRGGWEMISASHACEENTQGMSPIFQSEGHTLQTCQDSCESSKECKAVDFYAESGWCNYYSEPCQDPAMQKEGSSSYRLMSFSTEERADDLQASSDEVVHPDPYYGDVMEMEQQETDEAVLEAANNEAQADAAVADGAPKKSLKALIAVLASRSHVKSREAMRSSFKRAGFREDALMRFIICEGNVNETFVTKLGVQKEQYEKGDIIVVPCGSDHSLLTQTKQAMATFAQHFSKRPVMVVVKENTFVAWRQLQQRYVELAPWDYEDILCMNANQASLQGGFKVFGRSFVKSLLSSPQQNLASMAPGSSEERRKLLSAVQDEMNSGERSVQFVDVADWQTTENFTQYDCNAYWSEQRYLVHFDVEPEDINCLSRAEAADTDMKLGCLSVCQN